jgi:hypothetical protein
MIIAIRINTEQSSHFVLALIPTAVLGSPLTQCLKIRNPRRVPTTAAASCGPKRCRLLFLSISDSALGNGSANESAPQALHRKGGSGR